MDRVIGSGIVPRLVVCIIPENQRIAGIDGPRLASRRHPFDGVGSGRLAVGVVGFAFRHFDMAGSGAVIGRSQALAVKHETSEKGRGSLNLGRKQFAVASTPRSKDRSLQVEGVVSPQ